MNSQRNKQIFAISMPIIGGMLSQNILNLVDTAMVGSLGNAALAAMGLGGFVTFMLSAFLTSLGTGVQTAASRRKGEGRNSEIASSLNASLILGITLAPLWSVIWYFATDTLYPYLNSDPQVISLGSDYLKVRIIGITFITFNFCFRGYWNGTGNSKLYLKTIVIMHIANIFLNYILIYGNFGAPKLGVEGAGIATTASIILGSCIYFFLSLRGEKPRGFMCNLPSKFEMIQQLKVSSNVGVTQMFFAAGLTALYWIIGKIGTAELAAANILINVTLVAILPAIGFGLSSATLVGQALGRKDPLDAYRWGWDVVKLGMAVVATIGLPMVLFPELIIPIFTAESETVGIAKVPLMLSGVFLTLDAIGMILLNAMQGAGYAKIPMYISISFQWLLYLPMCYFLGPYLGLGLNAVWICHITYRSLLSGAMVALWKKGTWKLAVV